MQEELDIEDRRARFMDLTIPEYSYMLGFLHADGHLGGDLHHKGRLSVELNARDVELLSKFKTLTPWYSSIRDRHRNTNMKAGAHSAVWTVCAAQCRQRLAERGMPTGKKSKSVTVPTGQHLAVDYFRGLLDGDGSVGTTATGLPFVSFGTGSEEMARSIERFISSHTGKRKPVHPNRRDKFFQLSLFKEDAQHIIALLYYPGALALARKAESAKKAMAWVRPATMVTINDRRLWCDEADDIVRVSSIEGAAGSLGRTVKSIAARRQRLNKADHSRWQTPVSTVRVDWRNSSALIAFLGRPAPPYSPRVVADV